MNKDLSKETKIYYSNFNNIFGILCGVICLFGSYLLIRKNTYLSIGILLCGLFLLVIYVRRIIQNSPQIIINKQGIKPINKGVINWVRISHTEIRKEVQIKHINYYLDIYGKNKKGEIINSINITELGINSRKLEEIIQKHQIKNKN